MNLTGSEIAQATGGEWIPAESGERLVVVNCSTDTRTIQPGDIFIALKGERFDGHQYVGTAIERGATGLVVQDPSVDTGTTPKLIVSDTLRAMGDIAAFWRGRCNARRVAVVGSSGKTTTKNMLAGILASEAPTLASQANHNNLIGLPQTLFALREDHKFAVLEMGMNVPGELDRLAEIADPHVLVMTNIGNAHIGQFGSRDALLHAKGEALRRSGPSTVVVHNAGCPNVREAVKFWGEGRPTVSYAVSKPADVWADRVQSSPIGGYRFDLIAGDTRRVVVLPIFGRFNVANAVAAAAAAYALGVDLDRIVTALEAYRPHDLRSEVRQVGGITLIADCYNANPESMRESLLSLAEWPTVVAGRTFVVLGDMLELGENSPSYHREVGWQVARIPVEELLLIGHETPVILSACDNVPFVARHFDDADALAEHLIVRLRRGDCVFFKGSRGNRLERIVERVADAFAHRAMPIF
jgi:UDP-N-acetylmuramoyl-tripeptide--D-alanyl-D-alanine ligase